MVSRMLEAEREMLTHIDWLPESDDLNTCIRVLDLIYDRLELE